MSDIVGERSERATESSWVRFSAWRRARCSSQRRCGAYETLGRAVGVVGVITAVTMLVPPNVGTVGLVLSMLSLVPTAVWLVLLARRLRRLPA